MIKAIHASKLAQVMACPGSLFFKDLPEDPPSEAAREGTAFGELIEKTLKGLPIGTHASNGYSFDDTMHFHAPTVLEAVLRDRPVNAEVRVDWTTRAGIVIKAKYDISFADGDVLYVDDVKYGWGIVEPEENWQLIAYAIGEVIRQNRAFKEIALRIHQPRPYHHDGATREWRIPYDKLLELKEQIETHVARISEGFNQLATSKNCRYCRAAAICPAMNKAFFRGVEEVHEFLQDEIDEAEIAHQLDLIARIEDVVKIKKDSLRQLAISRIKDGGLIPNYIITESMSDRSWKPGTNPDVVKALCGKDIIETVMVSPAKAERMGVPKALVASLVERRSLGPSLKRVDTTKLANKTFGKPTKP
jgi:hypothetical protein